MAKTAGPITIKKYANRRLYNTGTSTYVTLDDLAVMVKNGDEFVVVDAKTGEDITRSVLAQIIFDQESKGPNLLPIAFLRQLIQFYGDSLQNLVPPYLEASLASLTREQGKLREHMQKAFGTATPFGPIDEQVRANMAMFERAFRMFTPFSPGGEGRGEPKPPAQAEGGASASELEELKRQLGEMRSRLDRMSETKG